MDAESYEDTEDIGDGSFGSVKLVKRTDGARFAMKKVPIGNMDEKDTEDALKECQLLASLRHPRIVDFEAAFLSEDKQTLCIVMEYCEMGDIAALIKKNNDGNLIIAEDTIWAYMVQIAEGLAFLHGQNIAHRDLKPGNIFLAADGSAKLGDLNVSKIARHGSVLETCVGTPLFMAPEVWEDEPYTNQCDLWGLGCVVYELAALDSAFKGKTVFKIQSAVLSGTYSPLPEGRYSSALSGVIGEMLVVDPEQRLSAPGVLSHREVKKRVASGLLKQPVAGGPHNETEEGGSVDTDLLAAIVITSAVAARNSAGGGGGGSGGREGVDLDKTLSSIACARANSKDGRVASTGSAKQRAARHQSRFEAPIPDFFLACGLAKWEKAFTEGLGVQCLADLAILTDKDLANALPSAVEVAAFKAQVDKSHVSRLKSKALVGLWVDVEGLGPGQVASFHKASVGLFFDSRHGVQFCKQGVGLRQVLLRRRKHLKWNKGARYTVLRGKPAEEVVAAALANDEASNATPPTTWLADNRRERGEGGDERGAADASARVDNGNIGGEEPADEDEKNLVLEDEEEVGTTVDTEEVLEAEGARATSKATHTGRARQATAAGIAI